MTELEIYKFVTENNIECRWQEWMPYLNSGDTTIESNLFIWIPPELLKEFCKLIGPSAFDDGGCCKTTLRNYGYICISNLDVVLDYYDIDAEAVFPKDKFK